MDDCTVGAPTTCSPAGRPSHHLVDVLCNGSAVGLCLWAEELHLQHPVSGEALHFTCPPPPLFQALLRLEAKGNPAPTEVHPTTAFWV